MNGEKITENELNQIFQCLQRAYSQKIRHSLTAIQNNELKHYTLQGFDFESYSSVFCKKKLGFDVSSEQVD